MSTSSRLNSIEKKAAYSLAAVFGLRMLGLFMILPVFAIYGAELEGYSPVWLGLAIGAYGLTQAVLQIPMGMLSDKFGRKPIIIIGLFVFLVGSIVAANATTIQGVVVGRALQGMGAIASAILALAADLSREEQRSKVMATIGMFIGFSFILSMMVGPIVTQAFGLSGLFWLTAILTVFAILVVNFIVPSSINKAPKGDHLAIPAQLKKLISHPQLLRLNVGVFTLHMTLSASFIVLPQFFISVGVPLSQHWLLYLSTLVGSIVVMVPCMIWALKKQKEKQMFVAAVGVLVLALGLFLVITNFLVDVCNKESIVAPTTVPLLVLAVLLFFIAFNYLEATMPSILSRITPAGVKGSAMGIFTTSQFLGAFSGGLFGGLIAQNFGEPAIFVIMTAAALVWFFVALEMSPIKKSKTMSLSFNAISEAETEELAQKVVLIPGVLEATLVHSDAVAYLKLDDKAANIDEINALLKS